MTSFRTSGEGMLSDHCSSQPSVQVVAINGEVDRSTQSTSEGRYGISKSLIDFSIHTSHSSFARIASFTFCSKRIASRCPSRASIAKMTHCPPRNGSLLVLRMNLHGPPVIPVAKLRAWSAASLIFFVHAIIDGSVCLPTKLHNGRRESFQPGDPARSLAFIVCRSQLGFDTKFQM